MTRLEKVIDPELRLRLEEAHSQLRTGKATDAVHTVSDAFLGMLAKKPELLEATVEVRAGMKMLVVMRWPALGANLPLDSVMSKEPRIEYTRDHFALSEAITYFEFAVDTAIQQGM